VLVDAHTHLQPHGEKPPVDRRRLGEHVETALANGLDGLVITEHLFRFHEAYDLLHGWWNADPNPVLAEVAGRYWRDHANLNLSEYVALIEEAKSDGLPVFLGLEMDWIPGKADELRKFLAPFDWDLVLGSVHWLGAFAIDDDGQLNEWAARNVGEVFDEYARYIEDLAASGLVDVLAHPDLPKLFGHQPPDISNFRRRIVAAALRGNVGLEINTNGLNKPVAALYPAPEILRAARVGGVPVTLASDAHTPNRLGQAFDAAIGAAREAGYEGYTRFVRRRRVDEPFAPLRIATEG
jgi:histidinol-phosphatase (PHP family)